MVMLIFIQATSDVGEKKKENTALKSRERNKEKLRADAQRIEQNLYKLVLIQGLYKKWNSGKGLYKKLMIIVIGLFFLL